MINKIVATPAATVAGMHDGATVMISGFGTAGMPSEPIAALIDQGARELTIVNNSRAMPTPAHRTPSPPWAGRWILRSVPRKSW